MPQSGQKPSKSSSAISIFYKKAPVDGCDARPRTDLCVPITSTWATHPPRQLRHNSHLSCPRVCMLPPGTRVLSKIHTRRPLLFSRHRQTPTRMFLVPFPHHDSERTFQPGSRTYTHPPTPRRPLARRFIDHSSATIHAKPPRGEQLSHASLFHSTTPRKTH